jgi:molecular chaperone HtpG
VDLLHIKRQVGELLNQIGGNGIFDEYTTHDIRHIDAMLKILDWIIPANTKTQMSTADWLMTVLGIYFHDLGLLVTKDEFRSRARSGFADFRDSVLFSNDDNGQDYKARTSALIAIVFYIKNLCEPTTLSGSVSGYKEGTPLHLEYLN